MNKTIVSKSGKEYEVREPRFGDEQAMLDYINALVEEDTFIMMNEKQNLEEEKKFLERAREEIEKGERVQLLVWDGDVLVANTQVTKGKYRQKHIGTFGISVAKEYRGEGIGYKTAEMVIDEAVKRLGVSIIELEYLEVNEAGKGLYEKLGFAEWGRFPKGIEYKGRLMARVYMSKEI